MASSVFNTIRSNVPCKTSPRGGVILAPLDKQQEPNQTPVDCQQVVFLQRGSHPSSKAVGFFFAVVGASLQRALPPINPPLQTCTRRAQSMSRPSVDAPSRNMAAYAHPKA